MRLPTLYKMDNKGKIRQWSIEVIEKLNGGNGAWLYQQTHGVKGGKMQSTSTWVQEGKNEGKSNETSPREQCILEATSLWTKQRDRKGYTETIPSEKPFGPMLAKSYDKDGKHIKFPCYVQPKLDGLRCIAKVENGAVSLWSRQNKQFKVLKHIEEELSKFPDGIYDGELYIHGTPFQTIVGAIKRDEKNENTEKIQYWIYDLINDNTNEKRQEELCSIFYKMYGPKPFDMTCIYNVLTRKVFNKDELIKEHKNWVDLKFEGIMLRNKHGLYKIGGRSADLQKYKLFMEEEFEIVDAEECVGKMEGMCTFKCKTKDGAIFDVMPEGDEFTRQQYWEDWVDGGISPGDRLTVKFFQWTDSTPAVPRFPIGKAIRNYD